MCRKMALGCLAALLISQSVQAVSYPLPPAGSRLVGSSQVITVPEHNTLPLEAFAAQYGQGLSNMLEANPGVDPFLPKSGTRLVIPQQLILPDTVREGIVVNVAEMRLYYYPPGSNTVEVLPIGIGQAGRETPRNWVTAVERKQVGPTWSPTPNTRRAYAAEGKTLPAFVPAGPDNPMGLYAIYIGRLYAIHGTNSNFGIGLRVSQGCIRLRNNDIKYLFDNVPVGTRVQLIDRPVKVTTEPDGSRWVEVHEPLSRNRAEFESTRKVPLPISAAQQTQLINEGAGAELERRSGMPVKLGN
ncbi:L,D-transpeptidase [Enterobacter roggenkampii]|uniref:L,D-transpeptidase n=1 Tax=Enterobacter roggenkampii TaxID=1812935 RepID=UPI000C1DF2E8|nr:L,D-transpeptidase [Enterobacter roggenkampii]EKM4698181.1 L,D-transpeptidase [Enterobacter roggenkampii]ELW9293835.1 L,D-transpeptidase [Enterobacter roggenkampii]MBW7749153.1 L,D-transpeptidase [Enterobacter roggenkampii]MCE1988991.1 L,D-transpeptidase [Enterobacter roggenkampii]MCK6706189.1 L,D-transpeptidase [Enterobacter roggenkampii]